MTDPPHRDADGSSGSFYHECIIAKLEADKRGLEGRLKWTDRALAATAAVFACCGAWRFAKGGCRFKGRDGEKADLASAWTEMTARPGAKKTNVPVTGDRVFTGEHSA